jgi:hypothetical protein
MTSLKRNASIARAAFVAEGSGPTACPYDLSLLKEKRR